MKFTYDDVCNRVRLAQKGVNSDGRFFPSDIVPHSSSFKYACKKLYEQGLLERFGDVGDRWGYQYKIIDREQAESQ
jgi:hypothetical protein